LTGQAKGFLIRTYGLLIVDAYRRDRVPYMVLCIDKPEALTLRRRTRAVHLEYMIRHRERIVFGGPLQDETTLSPTGSIFVLDFSEKSAVEAFLANEPYTQAGLFESVIIRRWHQIVPETEPGLLDRELARERAAAGM
jgi:uncharacterized protein YciI